MEENKQNRIYKFDKPEIDVSFEDWKKVINENFPDLIFPAEVCGSVISQILIKDITNPSAIILVDSPSSGKTITLNLFTDIPELTYPTDKFTPASFVSNAVNVKPDRLPEIDLLPRIKYKALIIRDMATFFSKGDDDLNSSLGILTRLLDGEGLITESGTHGQRGYSGEFLFMLLAGSTPIRQKIWKMMGNYGARLFFLKMHSKDKTEKELIDQLRTLSYKEKESVCRKVTKNTIKKLWLKNPDGINWDKTKDKEEHMVVITKCARILAKLRGVVNVWKDEFDYSYSQPTIERPDRINQLFYNLVRGHAVWCGRNEINNSDLRIIIQLCMDSVDDKRSKFLSEILKSNGTMTTSEVQEYFGHTKPIALVEMKVLKLLGVCSISNVINGKAGGQEKEIKLTEDFMWLLSEECKNIKNDNTQPIEPVAPWRNN